MRRRGCIARENWPGRSRGRRCSCGGCRRQEIEELAERSLSAALAHAQNRGESEAGSGFGDELTIDKDVSVIWGPRYNLATWLVNPACRAGDASPRDPGQWLYKIFLGPARAPLYLGKVTGDSTSLHERIRKHTTRGTAIPALTAATVAAEITRNKARLRGRRPERADRKPDNRRHYREFGIRGVSDQLRRGQASEVGTARPRLCHRYVPCRETLPPQERGPHQQPRQSAI